MFMGLMFDSIVLRVFPYVFSLSQHSRKLLNKRNSRDTNCEAEAMGPEDVGRGWGAHTCEPDIASRTGFEATTLSTQSQG